MNNRVSEMAAAAGILPVAQINPANFVPAEDGGEWRRWGMLYSGLHEGDYILGKNPRVKVYTTDQVAVLVEKAELMAVDSERSRLLADAGKPVGCGYVVKWETGDTASTYKTGYAQVLGVDTYTADSMAAERIKTKQAEAKCERFRELLAELSARSEPHVHQALTGEQIAAEMEVQHARGINNYVASFINGVRFAEKHHAGRKASPASENKPSLFGFRYHNKDGLVVDVQYPTISDAESAWRHLIPEIGQAVGLYCEPPDSSSELVSRLQDEIATLKSRLDLVTKDRDRQLEITKQLDAELAKKAPFLGDDTVTDLIQTLETCVSHEENRWEARDGWERVTIQNYDAARVAESLACLRALAAHLADVATAAPVDNSSQSHSTPTDIRDQLFIEDRQDGVYLVCVGRRFNSRQEAAAQCAALTSNRTGPTAIEALRSDMAAMDAEKVNDSTKAKD